MSFHPSGGSQSLVDDREVSVRILDAVAEKEGTSPLEFDRLLSDVVDPDALDTLLRSEDREVTVTFPYMGYRVRVESDGRVEVSDSSNE